MPGFLAPDTLSLQLTPLAHSQETVIVARFISGVAASTGGTLVGGTVADLFDAGDRGLPMSLYSFCAFGANGFGPAACGYVELKKGWRWIQWYQVRVSLSNSKDRFDG